MKVVRWWIYVDEVEIEFIDRGDNNNIVDDENVGAEFEATATSHAQQEQIPWQYVGPQINIPTTVPTLEDKYK